MLDDYEVQREIWESKIPVQFVLAEDEISAEDKPKLFCLLVPRVSYFPLVTEKSHKYFCLFVDPEEVDELWFWHYPVGVLFDLLKFDDALPWQIIVHFKRFPEDVIRCPNKETVESHFMQTVKEADQIKHRGEVISVMQKKDLMQLSSGLASDRFDQFWSINRKLMKNSVDCPMRNVPLRIYKHDQTYMQKLCKPFADDGEQRKLLSQVLSSGVPEAMINGDRYKIVSHGIEIPLDTLSLWLCENMSYPDNFALVLALA